MEDSEQPSIQQGLLVTHISPIVSGQSMMASLLAKESSEWSGYKLHVINSVYADKREKLGSFDLSKFFKLTLYILNIYKIVKKNSVKTVILTPGFTVASFLKDSIIIHFISLFLEVRIIGWVHMDPRRIDYSNRNKLLQSYITKTLSCVDSWVACAPSLCKQWPQFMPEQKTSILNTIPRNQFPINIDREKRLQTKKVIYIAGMEEAKGWRDLFFVAEELCREYTAMTFDFYGPPGNGVNREELEEFFGKSEFKNRIQWHDNIEGKSKHSVLEQASIFVLPSYTEQLPLSIIEAMSYELAIVSSSVGAVSDFLNADSLYTAGARKELKRAILNRYEHPEKVEAEGLEYRRKFKEFFSVENFNRSWLNCLQIK